MFIASFTVERFDVGQTSTGIPYSCTLIIYSSVKKQQWPSLSGLHSIIASDSEAYSSVSAQCKENLSPNSFLVRVNIST